MRSQTLAEARWIFAVLLLLMMVSWFVSGWLSLLFALLILYTFAFFRDPDRVAPADPDLIVAAADGVIADIIELDEDEFLKVKTRRIGIFCQFSTCTRTARRLMAASFTGNIGKAFASMPAVRSARRRTNL